MVAAAKKSKMRSETSGERVTVYLDPAQAKALRVHCAAERVSLSTFVAEAVRAGLKAAKSKAG